MSSLFNVRIETRDTISKLYVNGMDFSNAMKAELILAGGEIPVLKLTLPAENVAVNGEMIVQKETCTAGDGTGTRIIGSPRIRK